MKKVFIVGGSGMVASRVIELIKDKFEITSLDEKTVDITDSNSVTRYFDEHEFEAIVNFAAFTNVDAAEAQSGDEKGLVWRLNVGGPENLGKLCAERGKFLIHISTDFVFTGDETHPGPYEESTPLPDKPEGIGWYGWTKNRAENALTKIHNLKYSVIRYGYPFRADKYEAKNDWARNLLKLYNEHKLYPLFTDQVQSVVFIDDLAEPISKILDNELTGIFHIASKDVVSPYNIGKYLLEKYSGHEISLEKGLMSEFLRAPGRTPRPKFGGLLVDETEKKLGLKFKTWKEMVDEFVKQISAN